MQPWPWRWPLVVAVAVGRVAPMAREGQQFWGHEWDRSGRNESGLRRHQSANNARFSGQSSTRLQRRIERNDERERAKQHSNSDWIEHDKFVGGHRVLTHLRL